MTYSPTLIGSINSANRMKIVNQHSSYDELSIGN